MGHFRGFWPISKIPPKSPKIPQNDPKPPQKGQIDIFLTSKSVKKNIKKQPKCVQNGSKMGPKKVQKRVFYPIFRPLFLLNLKPFPVQLNPFFGPKRTPRSVSPHFGRPVFTYTQMTLFYKKSTLFYTFLHFFDKKISIFEIYWTFSVYKKWKKRCLILVFGYFFL